MIDPEVGVSNPASRLIKVDFPEPDSPIIAILSPDLIIKSMDDKICRIPSDVVTDLLKFSVTIILGMVCIWHACGEWVRLLFFID
jgi:hypothetical protein